MIMDERYIAAIDLGTSKIAVTVAQIDGQDVQMIYYRETPAEGIRNSFVFNPQKVAGPLKEAISEAENALKIKIRQAVVNLPRYEVRQETACASLIRSDKDSSITLEEINYLKSNAIDSYPLNDPSKEVMFGVVAQSFSTDEYVHALESDIEGMVSDTLDGNFKVFVGRKRHSDNVDRVMNLVDVAVAKKYFLPEVTAKAVLTGDEMENGVALIEIGSGSTSVTVYHRNIMRYYSSIPFGGRTITSDIKLECGISEQLAENIKLAYGVCMPEKLLTLRDKIIQINNEESGSCKQLSVKYLSEIITCRLKEIIEACLYMIQESGFADTLRNGVVLTGGSAGIPNLSSYLKELSGYNVRIGYPVHRFSYAGCNEINQRSAVASVGMVLAAKENSWINCLSEAPVRPVVKPVVVPAPVVEEETVAEEVLEEVAAAEAHVESPVAVEETAQEQVVSTGWIQDVPDPEPVSEPEEPEVEETEQEEPEQEPVVEPAEESEPEEEIEEPAKVKKEPEVKKKKPGFLSNIIWKVGNVVNNAINTGYDNSMDA